MPTSMLDASASPAAVVCQGPMWEFCTRYVKLIRQVARQCAPRDPSCPFTAEDLEQEVSVHLLQLAAPPELETESDVRGWLPQID